MQGAGFLHQKQGVRCSGPARTRPLRVVPGNRASSPARGSCLGGPELPRLGEKPGAGGGARAPALRQGHSRRGTGGDPGQRTGLPPRTYGAV